MDVTCEASHLGRVAIELFTDAAPKTAENFRSLCTGERGYGRWVPRRNGQVPLTYRGVPFHRVVPGFVVQGGDILCREGKCGLNLSGTVAMASQGPDRNGSQFFFNLARSPHLDGKAVVFGQVVDGWDVVLALSRSAGSRCGTPLKRAWISDCGQAAGSQAQEVAELASNPAPFRMPGEEVLNILNGR
jgi:peptidylprolyl isomerase